MKKSNKGIIKKLYNEGERLVPGRSHNLKELIRHRATYDFFRKIIHQDIKIGVCLDIKEKIRILDIGFGSGYGCYLLSRIPNVEIVGIDVAQECYEYATQKYNKSNIHYIILQETEKFLKENQFDYIVSCGVLEHIPNGIDMTAQNASYTKRALLSVPYREKPGNNPHHILFNISENDFNTFQGDKEFFYADLEGIIHNNSSAAGILGKSKLPSTSNHYSNFPIINVSACVRKSSLPSINSYFNFPLKPEKAEFLIRWQHKFLKLRKKIIKKLLIK